MCASAAPRPRLQGPGGRTALWLSLQHLAVVQLLCAYGAPPAELLLADDADDVPDGCAAWLAEARRWTSRLHYLEFLPPALVRALIVDGADLHTSDGTGPGAPTPLGLARALLARAPGAADEPAASARLVVDAAAPWSPANHALFPAPARARAVELLLLGHLLSREERFAGEGRALLDAWQAHVMAHAVCRAADA